MNYIALTIGPIYETIKYSKKTRELWAGSYFFSYFMKTLISKLYEDGNNFQFLLPYVDDKITKEHIEVGIFHDRFIASSTLEKEELQKLLENRVNETTHDMATFIGKNIDYAKTDEIYKALKNYLQYTYIIATKEELLTGTEKENIIFAIDAVLDSMELQNSFDFENSANRFTISEKDYSKKRGDKVNPVAKLQYQAQKLKKEIGVKELTFKTIPEIAISSILEGKIFKNFNYNAFQANDDIEKYEEFYKQFENDSNFKPHHKYFAVINADGDKMGSRIRNIYNENSEDITKLSHSIYEYIAREPSLVKLFEEYGGMLIYAGGDDLLGFAPVFGKNQKTFFDLLEDLSTRFQEYLGDDVSLSFGVSITYYKFPMIEAINKAHDLLFSKAKKHNTEKKSGSVALSLVKHSGQAYEGVFFLNDDLYKSYKRLFVDALDETIKLPHNLQHSLKQYESLILDIFKNYHDKQEEKLSAFFDNVIKDESHDKDAEKALDELKTYMLQFEPSDHEKFQILLSQLAIVKFLRGDK